MMITLLTVFLAGLPSVAADGECASGSFYFAKSRLFRAFSISPALQNDNTSPPLPLPSRFLPDITWNDKPALLPPTCPLSAC
jgi:hypothetical protein